MEQPLYNGHQLVEQLISLGLTKQQIGTELGLGAATISSWDTRDKFPRYAIMAMETLLRHKGAKPPRTRTRLAILTVPATQFEFIQTFVNKLGGSVKELEIY